MTDQPFDLADTTITSLVPAKTYLGRYVIEQPIGAGGMGEVYRARDTRLQRTVAIKVLLCETADDSVTRRRFLNEARAASALNHPNIVVLYDICTEENKDFLVMEFIAGRTLKELIAEKGLSLDQLAELGSQVALALSAAHAAGIVHRDIKPANIMVTKTMEAKVLDFGVAKIAQSAGDTELTGQGQMIGTVAYMSPEQVRGEDTDFRSDIFALGCVLYEAATGRQPFQATSVLGLMHEITTTDPEPPSVHRADLRPEFVRVVMRCLAKDRHNRPESAAELATELRLLTLPHREAPKAASDRRSVAVVPLKVRGPATDQYLSVSLAEALVHSLSGTGKLALRPISSVMRFTSEEIDWTRVARELDVDVVVEGAVQIAGGKIRVLVQVHQVSDGQTLASLKQDGESSDLFTLQDRLTDTVSAVFAPARKERIEPRVLPTKHPEAFEFYLRAVDRQVRVDKFEMASAIDLLTRATELDPSFADAWGLLAQAYAQMGSHLDPDPKWFDLGEQAIARTLELDPVQCTALCARGVIVWSPPRAFQNRAALRALNAAIKIDPTRPTARHQRSAVLWHLGFLDDAEHDATELQLTNPVLGTLHRGAIALQRGDYELSTEFYKQTLALEPNNILAHVMSPLAVLHAGRMGEARAAIDRSRRMFPTESFTIGIEAILAAADGERGRAGKLVSEALESGRSMTHTHHTWHSCAAAYALLGKPEEAIEQLERCAEMGLPNYRMFEADPYLGVMRNDSRFQDLMIRLRTEHESIRDEFGLGA